MDTTTTEPAPQNMPVLAAWAHALSDLALASHLQCLADAPRYLTAAQRKALIREAGVRLEEAQGR